jgi:hypothetical protein
MTAGSLDWFNFAGTNFSYATWNPVVDTPYYVVYDFDGARSRLFTDGVFRAGATAAQAFTAAVVGLGIGSQSGGGRPSNCRFDEVRVTNGMSRYGADANIPVPTAPFPRG